MHVFTIEIFISTITFLHVSKIKIMTVQPIKSAGTDAVDQAFVRKELYGTVHENTFSGALGFMRRLYSKDLQGCDFAVTGVTFDTATSHRPGARFGPQAIRAASANLAWGPPWPWGFDPFDRVAVVDYGDCDFDHGQPASVPGDIERHIDTILEAGVRSIVMGGDHYITLPIVRAHARQHGKISLIHFDAHSDTWKRKEEGGRVDHGTMFYQAVQEGIVDPSTSVQVGIRTHNSDPLGFTWLDAQWVHDNGPKQAIKEVHRIVGTSDAYLTFDIDCLDPGYAPGTGTPVCGGLTTAQAQEIIRGLGGLNIHGMDLVEVAPAYDVGEITALAGANLLLDFLCTQAQDLAPKLNQAD